MYTQVYTLVFGLLFSIIAVFVLYKFIWYIVKLIVFTIISLWVAGLFHLIIERSFLRYLYAKEIKYR